MTDYFKRLDRRRKLSELQKVTELLEDDEYQPHEAVEKSLLYEATADALMLAISLKDED